MPYLNLPALPLIRKSRALFVLSILGILVLGIAGDRQAHARCQIDPELAALKQIVLDYKDAIRRRQDIIREFDENQRLIQHSMLEMRVFTREMERASAIQILMSINLYSTAAQVSQRRFVDFVQKRQKLDADFKKWQSAWPSFMQRYWAHCDIERNLNRQQIEDRLRILSNADPEDYPALIATACLVERLGRFNEGLVRIEPVISRHTSLDSIALLTKSSILRLAQRDNDARIAYTQAQQALVWLPEELMPIYRFLRARLYATLGEYAAAQNEWQALSQIRSMELEAYRSLALLHCNRVGPSGFEAKQAVKEASTALALDSDPNWFSHFVMAMAYHAADQRAQALEQVQLASQKSHGENQSLCDGLELCIQNRKATRWDFRNTINR